MFCREYYCSVKLSLYHCVLDFIPDKIVPVDRITHVIMFKVLYFMGDSILCYTFAITLHLLLTVFPL